MKIAILTSGILPIPAVQGGAVETLVDHYLDYNNKHRLHDITVISVYHPSVESHPALQSDVNHYQYVHTTSLFAKLRKHIHRIIHPYTYYHYSIDFFLRQALSIIKKDDFDCIILENRPGFALQLRDVTKAKLVYHLHNDFLNCETPQCRDIYQAATRIITVSDYISRRVRTCNQESSMVNGQSSTVNGQCSMVNYDKCVTVYNGIDVSAFEATPVTRQSLGYDDSDFILAFSGRLIREKGIMELIEAMNILKDEPRIKLLVMGNSFYANASGEDPFISELKSRAVQLGDRIKFTGYISHAKIPSYLRMCDAAVIPSTWEEPFGLTVLEAMAARLPIITTDRGGIPEIVTSRNAIVIPLSEDFVSDLSRYIISLFRDDERRKSMGDESRQLALRYTSEEYAKNFFAAI